MSGSTALKISISCLVLAVILAAALGIFFACKSIVTVDIVTVGEEKTFTPQEHRTVRAEPLMLYEQKASNTAQILSLTVIDGDTVTADDVVGMYDTEASRQYAELKNLEADYLAAIEDGGGEAVQVLCDGVVRQLAAIVAGDSGGKSFIRAGVSGKIRRSGTAEGLSVREGDLLWEIVDDSTCTIVLADIAADTGLKLSQNIPLYAWDTLEKLSFTAKVTKLGEPHGVQDVQTLDCELVLSGDYFAYTDKNDNVTVILDRTAVTGYPVPVNALCDYNGGKTVWTVSDGRAHAVAVTVAYGDSEQLYVNGIAAGDTVIVPNGTELTEGKKVRAAK